MVNWGVATTKPEVLAKLSPLARNMKLARKRLNLTQEGAANLAFIDSKRWQMIERDKANVTFSTVERIAKVFRMDPYLLMCPNCGGHE